MGLIDNAIITKIVAPFAEAMNDVIKSLRTIEKTLEAIEKNTAELLALSEHTKHRP